MRIVKGFEIYIKTGSFFYSELPEFEESYDITIQNIINFSHRGIILYLEYHSVCPFVRIGSAHPPPASECVPPFNLRGGQHSPAGEGMGGPNSDDWRESLALCLLYDFSCCSNAFFDQSIKNVRLRLLKHFKFR